MLKGNKNFLSVVVLIMFVLLAMGSKVNKMHYGAFNYNNRVEDNGDDRNYIVKNDGTKIYGNKISWKSGLFSRDLIKIDGDAYKIAEIRGYKTDDVYYGRIKNEYIKRIVHGKVNVYVMFTEVTETSTDHGGFSHSHTYVRTDQYAQRGENGPMVGIAGQGDIKRFLSDCPLSVQMVDISNGKMRKAIRKNRNYLNSVFEVYNNNCKPLEQP